MPAPPVPPEKLAAAVEAYSRLGDYQKVAVELGVPYSTASRWVKQGRVSDDPLISEAAKAAGVNDTSVIAGGWRILRDEDGNGWSIRFRNDAAEADLADIVAEATEEIARGRPELPPREYETGEYLGVIDPADVHFLKLCVESETGYTYNRDVAAHRFVEGVKAILSQFRAVGVARILFVVGNDILHIDTPKKTTTSGTPQDVDGTIEQGFRDALRAVVWGIEEAAKLAPVDVLFCPSNHDWLSGYMLAQTVSAWFRNDPNVTFSEYGSSLRHRKYYRFGGNLIGLSHGDGAKEESLYALMVTEARTHISAAPHRYWLLHHFHHKSRRRRGQRTFLTEKDHIGMTAVHVGDVGQDDDMIVEYVRSPSPPDGWHDRNGYVNRQAVEAFLFHHRDGMTHRFTEWF